jgi:hypothetical protein
MADFESKVISSRAVLPIQGSVAGDFGLGTQYRSAGFDAAAVRSDGLAEPRSRAPQLPDLARIFAVDGPAGAGYVDLNGRLAPLAGGQDANGGRPWRTGGAYGSYESGDHERYVMATLPNAQVLRSSRLTSSGDSEPFTRSLDANSRSAKPNSSKGNCGCHEPNSSGVKQLETDVGNGSQSIGLGLDLPSPSTLVKIFAKNTVKPLPKKIQAWITYIAGPYPELASLSCEQLLAIAKARQQTLYMAYMMKLYHTCQGSGELDKWVTSQGFRAALEVCKLPAGPANQVFAMLHTFLGAPSTPNSAESVAWILTKFTGAEATGFPCAPKIPLFVTKLYPACSYFENGRRYFWDESYKSKQLTNHVTQTLGLSAYGSDSTQDDKTWLELRTALAIYELSDKKCGPLSLSAGFSPITAGDWDQGKVFKVGIGAAHRLKVVNTCGWAALQLAKGNLALATKVHDAFCLELLP